MVNQTAQSLLAEFAESDDFDLGADAGRSFSPLKEQSSSARYATQARYSRRRNGKSQAPDGPRRRLRKSSSF